MAIKSRLAIIQRLKLWIMGMITGRSLELIAPESPRMTSLFSSKASINLAELLTASSPSTTPISCACLRSSARPSAPWLASCTILSPDLPNARLAR